LDSFDIRNAPRTDGAYFLGDYEGLSSDGQDFVGFWSRPVPGRTSVRATLFAP
jgi:hypothetical protein